MVGPQNVAVERLFLVHVVHICGCCITCLSTSYVVNIWTLEASCQLYNYVGLLFYLGTKLVFHIYQKYHYIIEQVMRSLLRSLSVIIGLFIM